MDWAAIISESAPAAIAAIVTGAFALGVAWFKMDRMARDLDEARAEITRKKARIDELERAGREQDNPASIALSCKSALVSTLNDVLDHAGAERATLYLPVNDPAGDFLGLLVLCTAPTDLSDRAFHGTLFSGRDSRAVEAFLEKQAVQSEATSFTFDGYHPDATYADCLFGGDDGGPRPVSAVVQVLARAGQLDARRCAEAIAQFSETLKTNLGFFHSETRERLALVGLGYPARSRRGTVMMFDITNSTALFANEARALLTMTVMERVMNFGFRCVEAQGGVIENFTGDGFLASFSQTDRSNASSAMSALIAARQMEDAFGVLLRDLRPTLGPDTLALQSRFGIATGVVHELPLSVGQLRANSIIGRTTSTASILCSAAPRERPVIAIDRATLMELEPREQRMFAPVPKDRHTAKMQKRGLTMYLEKGHETRSA